MRESAISLEEPVVRALRADLRGELLLPTDSGYQAARRIWNGHVDRGRGSSHTAPASPTCWQRSASRAYGPNYARLAALKRTYDPTNVFRCNQNVLPATA